MRKVAEKYKGMFWHVHHYKLVEWSDDIRERVAYIKKEKPKYEIKVRLKLMLKVKGKIPAELEEAYAKWKEATAKWKEAYAKVEEADAKWKEANAKWKEADAKWKEAYAKRKEADAKCLPQLEKLHAEECGCKEWNGKELEFK